MSKLSEYIKSRKEKDIKFFFGNDTTIMNSNILWSHFKDNDHIIIATTNVKYFRNKDTYVLVVGNNKIVYLQYWQVKPIKNWNLQTNGYAVKLTRNFFKTYDLSFSFDDMSFEKEDTFDSLLNVAKEQDNKKVFWKLGHYDCI